jgi:hypothetical protein
MVKIAKTRSAFEKLKDGDFNYGPEIFGNVDVPGGLLAERSISTKELYAVTRSRVSS